MRLNKSKHSRTLQTCFLREKKCLIYQTTTIDDPVRYCSLITARFRKAKYEHQNIGIKKKHRIYPILLDILAKVGREDTANGAVAFVCVSTNEKMSSSIDLPKNYWVNQYLIVKKTSEF